MKSLSQLKIFLAISSVFLLPLSFNACKGFEGASYSSSLNTDIDNSETSSNSESNPLKTFDVSFVSHNKVELLWTLTESGDYSYSIFRNDELIGTVDASSYIDNEVLQNTTYIYKLYVVDNKTGKNLGNESITVITDVYVPTDQLIFFDNFDSGPISNHWSYLNSVNVSSNKSKSGTRSLEFYFKGGDENTDSHAEARFDLGSKYKELTIVFDLYVPDNFNHRNAPGPDNNKFLRLWTNTYNDLEKVGVSTWSQSNGGSAVGEDFVLRQYSSMSTMITSRSDWIGPSDKGKWMSVKIYIKVSNDQEFGQIKLYKNGTLFHENTQVDNNHIAGEQGLQFGYLLGWANSGFTEGTYMYIDNVAFYSGKVEN